MPKCFNLINYFTIVIFRKLDCQQELEDFTEESRQLETELEATIEQNEKSLKDLRSALNQQQLENDSIRVCIFIN